MYISNLTHFTSELIKDKSRKNLIVIIWEMIFLSFYYKSIPYFYFSRHLYKKDRVNIKDYLPNKFFSKFSGSFNDPSSTDLLDNKLFFDFFFRSFKIPLPKILMYNYGNKFIIGNECILINNENDFASVLKSLTEKSSTKSVFIKKSSGSLGGESTFRFSENDLLNNQKVPLLFKNVLKSTFIYQETIDQHEDLNLINDSCINTIRIDSFTDKDGNVEIISAFLRMASSKKHIDNISSGGCFVGIDLKTGTLKKFAYTSVVKSGGEVLNEHPVSHVKFENFKIPYFEEVKNLVLRAASYVPNLRLVGWDVAISKTGPVLVEGNKRYAIQCNDLTYGGYKRNPVFKKVLQEFFELKNHTN